MFKDIYDSVKENFSQKARNPFLATILIVWSFKNWRLIYGLFNFDEKATQADKLAYIESYFQEFGFYSNLGKSVGYAFIVLIATYSLLGLSRLIVDFYENIALPRIKKLTNPRSIVSKETHDEALKAIEETEEKLNKERMARSTAQKEREEFENINLRLLSETETLHRITAERDELESKATSLEISLSEYKNRQRNLEELMNENEVNQKRIKNYDQKIKKLTEDQTNLKSLEEQHQELKLLNEALLYHVKNFGDNDLGKKLDVLRRSKLKDDFFEVGKKILNRQKIDSASRVINYFKKLGLIVPDELNASGNIIAEGNIIFSFTKTGKAAFDNLSFSKEESKGINMNS